jgi:hypothetical protein
MSLRDWARSAADYTLGSLIVLVHLAIAARLEDTGRAGPLELKDAWPPLGAAPARAGDRAGHARPVSRRAPRRPRPPLVPPPG